MHRTGIGTAVAFLLAAGLTAGCATTSPSDWTGHRIDEVIKEFGKPTGSYLTGEGRTMYVWTRRFAVVEKDVMDLPGSGGHFQVPGVGEHSLTWRFLVNPDGTVAGWSRQGGNQPSASGGLLKR